MLTRTKQAWRRMRIASAAITAVLAYYFVWLFITERPAPAIDVFAFLPFVVFTGWLLSPRRATTQAALAFAVGVFTIVFSYWWTMVYAWEFLPFGFPSFLVLLLAQLTLLQYRQTGRRSFVLTESSEIRATADNRAATAADSPSR